MTVPGTLTVLVNGEAHTLDPSTMLCDLVAKLTSRDQGIALAHNGTVVPRGRWATTPLRDGDAVEIVTAVQGG